MDSVRQVRYDLPFCLLKPVRTVPRTDIGYYIDATALELESLWEAIERSSATAIDFETKGTEYHLKTDYPVGVGFAFDEGLCYIDFKTYQDSIPDLIARITKLPRLIAHNVYFDGGWLYREHRQHPQWLACTYGLFRQLATEGFEDQRWSLKYAQKHLLGWKKTNEEHLDRWLIDNGYVRKTDKQKKAGHIWYEKWTEEGEGRWVKPQKAEMWRAPCGILGHYCALDCEATLLFYQKVLEPALASFPALRKYHNEEFMTLVELLIQQKVDGMLVDRPRLEARSLELEQFIQDKKLEFRHHEQIRSHIIKYEQDKRQPLYDKEPEQYLKRKGGKEPARLKKDGTISKSWESWQARQSEPLQVSKNWEKWKLKVSQVEAGELKDYNFNMNSGLQKRWLLYDCLNFPVIVVTGKGLPACGGKALQGMGDVGRVLKEHDKAVKELGYVTAYLSYLTEENTLHPGFIVPGTLTLRCSGTRPNFLQVPKSYKTLACFVPRPGKAWVDFDLSALEQVVLAELSQDKALMNLYGPGRPKQDVYLFNACAFPGIGDVVRASGYDPDNPTPDGIANAKKTCKKERSISKVITLASAYGAGTAKLLETLTLSGIDISFDEVADIKAAYWELYSGVKRYEQFLLRQYTANGGWVEDGSGLPTGIAQDYTKDIVNRVCQKTGHNLHMRFVYHVNNLLKEEGISVTGIIWDFHDQLILECDETDAKRLASLLEGKACDTLNKEVQGSIPLKGEAMIIDNLAKCKLPEEDWLD